MSVECENFRIQSSYSENKTPKLINSCAPKVVVGCSIAAERKQKSSMIQSRVYPHPVIPEKKIEHD